jgi:SAM-dependent methyltransferase
VDLADLYSRVAPIYAEQGPPYFAHAGQRLVELASVGAADVVLDVGTGRGAVLLPAARRVGPTGRAIGIDVAPGMVEHTRASITAATLSWASVELMPAEQAAFEPETFTHVLSSFSVFFLADLARTLVRLRQMLRPGGRIGFAFSRGTDPRWSWYEDLLRQYGAIAGQVAQRGHESVRQPGVLTGELEADGFVDVWDREESVELFYASPEAWWASLWTHGSRRALEALSPTLLSRVQAESLARVRALAEPRGVPERMTLAFVLGQRV